MKVTIGRVIDPNTPSVRTYTSHTELTRTACMGERGFSVTSVDGSEGNPFAEALLEVPGVVAVMVKPYSANVLKAEAFEWSEIEPALLRLFAAFNTGEGSLEIEL